MITFNNGIKLDNAADNAVQLRSNSDMLIYGGNAVVINGLANGLQIRGTYLGLGDQFAGSDIKIRKVSTGVAGVFQANGTTLGTFQTQFLDFGNTLNENAINFFGGSYTVGINSWEWKAKSGGGFTFVAASPANLGWVARFGTSATADLFQIETNGNLTMKGSTLKFPASGANVIQMRDMSAGTFANVIENGFYTFNVGRTDAVLNLRGPATFNGTATLAGYTFATVPSASANAGATIRITDRSHRLATSDGTSWNWAGTTTPIS